jgi:hypothetical protein
MKQFKEFILETKIWMHGDFGSYELSSKEFYLKGKEVRLSVMIKDKMGVALITRIGTKNKLKKIIIKNRDGSLVKNKKLIDDIINVLMLYAEESVDYSKIKVKGFNTTTTDMPHYDNILADPLYFKKNKKIIFSIELMSPDIYLFKTKKGFKTFGKEEVWRQDEKAEEYAKLMKKGVKFPMLVLDFSTKNFNQEGRHRAIAANILNIKKVPVMIVRKI